MDDGCKSGPTLDGEGVGRDLYSALGSGWGNGYSDLSGVGDREVDWMPTGRGGALYLQCGGRGSGAGKWYHRRGGFSFLYEVGADDTVGLTSG